MGRATSGETPGQAPEFTCAQNGVSHPEIVRCGSLFIDKMFSFFLSCSCSLPHKQGEAQGRREGAPRELESGGRGGGGVRRGGAWTFSSGCGFTKTV